MTLQLWQGEKTVVRLVDELGTCKSLLYEAQTRPGTAIDPSTALTVQSFVWKVSSILPSGDNYTLNVSDDSDSDIHKESHTFRVVNDALASSGTQITMSTRSTATMTSAISTPITTEAGVSSIQTVTSISSLTVTSTAEITSITSSTSFQQTGFPTSSSASTTSAIQAGTAAAVTSSAAVSSAATPSPSKSKRDGGLSAGVIAGIAIGGLAAAALLLGLGFVVLRQRRRIKDLKTVSTADEKRSRGGDSLYGLDAAKYEMPATGFNAAPTPEKNTYELSAEEIAAAHRSRSSGGFVTTSSMKHESGGSQRYETDGAARQEAYGVDMQEIGIGKR